MPDDPPEALGDPPSAADAVPFRTVAEAAGEAFVVTSADLDPPGPTILYVNPAFTRMTGYAPAEVIGQSPRLLQGPGTERSELERMRRELAAGGAFRGEAVNYRKDGSPYINEWMVTAVRDEAGAIGHWLSIQRDVTEERAAEAHLQGALAALQTGVRHTVGLIRTLARRSAETGGTLEDYAMHLDGRIGAVARVLGKTTREPGAGVDLAGLVADELQAHAAREGERASVEGPVLRLSSDAAEAVGLALHELAANAVKYGALSAEDGRIAVSWREEARADGTWLVLAWAESGLRGVGAPARRGFGTEQLEEVLPAELGAEVTSTYGSRGLRCTIALPLGGGVLAPARARPR